MAERLCPFVYWGQKNDHISLKIELRDVSGEIVDLMEDKLTFNAHALGVRGSNEYGFDIKFYLPIDADNSRYRINDRNIEFQLRKKVIGEVWPRLTFEQIKHPWLKIDFDKFAMEDDSDDKENELVLSEKEMIDRFEKEIIESKSPAEMPNLKSSYLFLYNLFQFIGFVYICCSMQYQYYKNGEASKDTIFETVGGHLMVLQFFAILEFIHPMIGLVNTGVIAPFIQVMGRNFILFIVIAKEPSLQTIPAVWYLIIVWSMIELVRYPYYMLQCLGKETRLITWLRYTAWIPLYPLGILIEGTIIIAAIPFYERTGKYSLELPNAANVAFYFPWFLHLYLLLMFTTGYRQLAYMYKQRKRKMIISKYRKTK